MMKLNKASLNNINHYLLVLISLISVGLSILFVLNNYNLDKQVILRDKLIEDMRYYDSIANIQRLHNDTIIGKYISNSGIVINNKPVTNEELVALINRQIDEVDSLKHKVILLQDSLYLYKSFVDLTKRNLNVNYKINEVGNQRTISIEIPTDTLMIYKNLYEIIERDYGIRYIIKNEGRNYIFKKVFTKADSALMIFDYYKNKLRRDNNGNWIIIYPKE